MSYKRYKAKKGIAVKRIFILLGVFIGAIVISFSVIFGLFFGSLDELGAATNIYSTSTDHWAWMDLVGWIDFLTDNVYVWPNDLDGYASSSVGEISLNCDNSPLGSICGSSNYQVKNNNGNLSGWAWNDVIGWISFCGINNLASSSPDCPFIGVFPNKSYQVVIDTLVPDQPPSDFTQYAWNDLFGWISFNCSNDAFAPSFCEYYGTQSYEDGYKVRTNWFATSTVGDVYSSVFDTGVEGGAQFNSVALLGSIPNGTEVSLQVAVSNSEAGPWDFIGPSGTSADFYKFQVDSTGQSFVAVLDYRWHSNYRYFRYRLRLKSDDKSILTPRIEDVIINWSP